MPLRTSRGARASWPTGERTTSNGGAASWKRGGVYLEGEHAKVVAIRG